MLETFSRRYAALEARRADVGTHTVELIIHQCNGNYDAV